MSDIFISYSSKDREQADQLSELLRSAGLSVWIDQQGIDVATNWSREIVQAINDCKAFVVLLSPSSLGSHNVIKEVSLASEKRKRILPLDLEPVTLNADFEYALAGLQRSPMSNIDGIIRALGKLGLEATGAPVAPKIVKEPGRKKSLMILPFEDLSPTGDNQWFTDGMASELIGSLSKIKVLRVIDWNTSKLFRERRIKTIDLARELQVQFFIEGQVRKFGDKIKASILLLDIDSGDHLWQETLSGNMDDIFDMQETVAKKVLSGLEVILTTVDRAKLGTHATLNVEAYECYLKARECFLQQTTSGFERALALNEAATQLDPSFTLAWANVAASCNMIMLRNGATDELSARAHMAVEQILRNEGESSLYCWIKGELLRISGDLDGALECARSSISKDPESPLGYYTLAGIYHEKGLPIEAAEAYQKTLLTRPRDVSTHGNVINALYQSGHEEKLRESIELAIPLFKQHLRLNPHDDFHRVRFACALFYGGNVSESLDVAGQVRLDTGLDLGLFSNLLGFYRDAGRLDLVLQAINRVIGNGTYSLETLQQNLFTGPQLSAPEVAAMFIQNDSSSRSQELH